MGVEVSEFKETIIVDGQKLRLGFTTGACAAAAAKAATMLALSGQRSVGAVDIWLPVGGRFSFPIHSSGFSGGFAWTAVKKFAGDDPDVTNGAIITAHVSEGSNGTPILVQGGKGVGVVTKKGLPVPQGLPAINPVPMRMIHGSVEEAIKTTGMQAEKLRIRVVIGVEEGEKLGLKTLNPRLGIVDGISILGTTGIVKPISAQAWKDTISIQLDMAVAYDCDTIAVVPGRTSERRAQQYFNLPEEALIPMGDYVAHTLSEAARKGIAQVLLVGQFGKISKIAMGYENTNYKKSTMRLEVIARWAQEMGLPPSVICKINQANTAREVCDVLRAGGHTDFFLFVLDKAIAYCRKWSGYECEVSGLVLSYEGGVIVSRL